MTDSRDKLGLNDAGLPQARAVKPKAASRARLSDEMKGTIETMAYKGLPLHRAAEEAGMDVASARKAFRKAHVKASYYQLLKDIRDNAGQEAYLRINNMSMDAASETVKLEANT